MDSSMPINSILEEMLTKLDCSLEPPGFIGDARTKHIMKNTLSKAIDAIGEQSAIAQGLKRVITTAEKLQESPTHLLYILKDPNGDYGHGEVIGILKVGKKHLYLYDELDCVHEVEPLCVLDFFVKAERQRSGYGKFMFDYMLNDLKVDVNELAIDGPSPKMMLFLQRNYGLHHMVRQTNNFAVSSTFFANGSQNGGKRLNRSEMHQAAFGRYGAPRPHSTVGSVIHGDNSHFDSSAKPSPSNDMVDSDLTEELEQVTITDGRDMDRLIKISPSAGLKMAPLRPSTLRVNTEPSAAMPFSTNKANTVYHNAHPLNLSLKDNTPAAGLPSNANNSPAIGPFEVKKLIANTSSNATPAAGLVSNGNKITACFNDKPIGNLTSKDNMKCHTVNANTPAAGVSTRSDKLVIGLSDKNTSNMSTKDNTPAAATSYIANTKAVEYNMSTPAAGLSSAADTPADVAHTSLNNQMTRTGFIDIKFYHSPLW